MTADYFKNDFGLTGREGAALLIGAHSFGSFNDKISQFRYDWTRKQGSMLNNQLFRLNISLTHFLLQENFVCKHFAEIIISFKFTEMLP